VTDWRLEHLEQQPFLRDVAFRRSRYRKYRPGWDHDHCVGCWAKFAEFDSPEETILHEGFATTDEFARGAEYYWACQDCFTTFKDQMGWREV
jgi:hypothetical protein